MGLWEAYRYLPPPLVDFGRVNSLTCNMVFSADGGMLITGGPRGTINVYETRTGALRRLRCGSGEPHRMDVAPDGSLLAMTDTGALKQFDPASGRTLRTIEVPAPSAGHGSG